MFIGVVKYCYCLLIVSMIWYEYLLWLMAYEAKAFSPELHALIPLSGNWDQSRGCEVTAASLLYVLRLGSDKLSFSSLLSSFACRDGFSRQIHMARK